MPTPDTKLLQGTLDMLILTQFCSLIVVTTWLHALCHVLKSAPERSPS
jgi:hypothetical protein